MHEMAEKRYRIHNYRTDDRTYKQTGDIRRKWQGVLIARCTRHVHVGVRCQVVRIEYRAPCHYTRAELATRQGLDRSKYGVP